LVLDATIAWDDRRVLGETKALDWAAKSSVVINAMNNSALFADRAFIFIYRRVLLMTQVKLFNFYINAVSKK
jgi:hypothetical protein